MVKYCILSFLLHAATRILPIYYVQGDPLVEPNEISSSGGVLDVTFAIEYGTYSQTGFQLTDTRLLDGTLPGTTLRLSPGDTMNILYQNNLELQPGAVSGGENIYRLPDHSNLHFHGGHVSGELPSDDVRFNLPPGEEYQYSTLFPDNHMGGTHWIHPHVHGSATLQVAGGAAKAMIVEDPAGFLPTEISDATEVLLLFQEMDPDLLQEVVDDIGDGRLKITNSGGLPNRWRIVNGQYQPTYSMTTNTWYRFRMIHAGFGTSPLDLEIDGCEMVLLAKDGVYIRDFPRTITQAPIPAGGRADAMVRCTTAGSYPITDFADQTVMTLEVTGSGSASSFSSWTPDYPDYLTDLRQTSASPGCTCTTNTRSCADDIFCINDFLFDPNEYQHTIEFGSVVERDLGGVSSHPYHQHVYPFQIIELPFGMSVEEEEYWAVGDWHDVIMIDFPGDQYIPVRYIADVHTGTVMIHCHVLFHEDKGTMSQELIVDTGSCACDVRSEPVVDSTCFSAVATVNAENKGRVLLKDLRVGDKVLTGSGGYETVYMIDHKHPTKTTLFLQIYSTETTSPLEITDTHMVFVNDTKNAIPAHKVRVGDKIQTLHGDSTVTKISHTTRNGIWNPITTDGTIVVDGVIASTYSVTFRDETIRVAGFDLMSHHDFIHLVMAPYRAVCLGLSLSLCESSHELNAYSWLGSRLVEFGLAQNVVVQDTMILAVASFFRFLSFATNPLAICFVVGALSFFFLANKKQQQTSRSGRRNFFELLLLLSIGFLRMAFANAGESLDR